MENKIKFEYIMSALGMCGFNEHTDLAKTVINEYLKDNIHDFGMLFNAMTEAAEGPKYYNNYHYNTLMSDSGGLQITTLGLNSQEIKKKQNEIYKIQALYSDVAMCFDEMPLLLNGKVKGSQSRLDFSNRYFIKELIPIKAKETVENIKKQIQVFQSLDSNTKIMIIAHGNNQETYKEYTETIINSLSDNELQYIHGIAPSGACNGIGTIERYDMLYSLGTLDIPDYIRKNIHLLGVGSKDALLPLIANLDYFSFIDKVSYDSSSAPRKYRIDGDGIYKDSFGKNDTIDSIKRKYMNIFKYYEKYFKIIPNWNYETFIEKSTYYSSLNSNKIWMYRDKSCETYNSLALLIWFFVPAWKMEQVQHSIKVLQNKTFPIFSNIKTYNDYLYAKKDIIRYYKLTSNKIKGVDNVEMMNNDIFNKNIFNELF